MKRNLFLFCLAFFAVSAFSQNAVSLDTGLNDGVKYFQGRLTKGTKLVVLNFKSPMPRLSEYVIEELTACIVNSNFFKTVDRSNLELIQQEMKFQLSGEVNDDDIRALGKKLGAQTIITGSIEPFSGIYRLRIRALDIETAEIQGLITKNIQKDHFLITLTDMPAVPSVDNTPSAGNALPASITPPGDNPPQPQPAQPPRSGNSGGRVSLPDYLFN